jgi:4-hydroxybenzoate polyprenyltransferase
MDALINLLKDSQVGIWCKRAAWVILIIGLFQVISTFLLSSGPWGHSPDLPLTQYLQFLVFSLAPLPSAIFYFFLLYAAGVIVNRLVDYEGIDEEDAERYEDVTSDKEVE